jgi:VacB/RNase II family 3'-5' exoribonuclease
MTHDLTMPIDLRAVAYQTMLDAGFAPDIPPEVEREVQALDERQQAAVEPSARDLRSLLWSSIDNPESRDLDQVEFAERQPGGAIRVLVAIADVDAFVPAGSATDRHAAENATSVYTGVTTFPMLPERLSNDLTSLLEGEDRLAVVIDMLVDEDGSVPASTVYCARIQNHAKLDYESVGAWLEDAAPPPGKVVAIAGLEQQLRLQNEVTGRLRELRRRNGALDLETIEASTVVADGAVVDLTVKHKNRARYLIENFMIGANSAMAAFLERQGSPAIQRVVRSPERWPRIMEIAASSGVRLPMQPDSRALADFLAQQRVANPEHFPDLSLAVVKLLGSGQYDAVEPGVEHPGHFGLAAHDYTHATAPNRRYADLVIQRLLKAALAGQPPPYTMANLAAIAECCTERDKAAKKVELRMRKIAAAALLSRRIGEVFDAIVTGVTEKGTFARLLAPPAEGRVVRGEQGLDVGDRVRLRLTATDPTRGFIDFERAGVPRTVGRRG